MARFSGPFFRLCGVLAYCMGGVPGPLWGQRTGPGVLVWAQAVWVEVEQPGAEGGWFGLHGCEFGGQTI